jgi:hypothetical protein
MTKTTANGRAAQRVRAAFSEPRGYYFAAILLAGAGMTRAQAPAAPAAAPAPTGRLIARAGTELEARADAPACAPRVKVTITAKDAKLFEGEIPAAAKFFTNARAGHSLSCPQMTRMVAQGKSGGKVMFTAMADQSNGWEAMILGATILDSVTEESALASSGGPTPKSVFRSSPGFVQANDILTRTKDKFLCVAGTALTCEMILKFTPQSASKLVITNRHALSGGKSAAVVTTEAAIRDGFICADPNTSGVVIDDAQMSEDAKGDYAEQLLERVKSNGEICSGFSDKAGALTIYGFNPTGSAVDRPRAITLSSTLPAFGAPK